MKLALLENAPSNAPSTEAQRAQFSSGGWHDLSDIAKKKPPEKIILLAHLANILSDIVDVVGVRGLGGVRRCFHDAGYCMAEFRHSGYYNERLTSKLIGETFLTLKKFFRNSKKLEALEMIFNGIRIE